MLGEEVNRLSSGSDPDQGIMNQSGEVYNRLQQLAEEGDANDEERQRLNKEASDSDSDTETDSGDIANTRSSDLGLRPPSRSPRSSSGTRSPTLHVVQTPELQTEEGTNSSTGELAGIYLGILNLFITLPQFIGSFMSFIVFAILEPGKSPELAEGGGDKDQPPEVHKGVNAIAVTMLLGGLGSIVAAYRTYKLPKVR